MTNTRDAKAKKTAIPIADNECLEWIARLSKIISLNEFSNEQLQCLSNRRDIYTYDVLTKQCHKKQHGRDGIVRSVLDADCMGRELCNTSYERFKSCWIQYKSHEECAVESNDFCRCTKDLMSEFLFSLSPATNNARPLLKSRNSIT